MPIRAWIAGVLLLGLAAGAARRLAYEGGATFEESELRFYPSGRMLPLLTLGQPTLLADIAWLEAIQYYGKHRKSDRRYPHAAHLFDVITAVDPAFRSAYIFGALVLEDESPDPSPAHDLLTRGMRANPDDWMIAFHRGFLASRRMDAREGALDMARAARLPGAPPFAARLAAHACGRTGSPELAVEIWRMIAEESQDPALRHLAEERIDELIRRSAPQADGGSG